VDRRWSVQQSSMRRVVVPSAHHRVQFPSTRTTTVQLQQLFELPGSMEDCRRMRASPTAWPNPRWLAPPVCLLPSRHQLPTGGERRQLASKCHPDPPQTSCSTLIDSSPLIALPQWSYLNIDATLTVTILGIREYQGPWYSGRQTLTVPLAARCKERQNVVGSRNRRVVHTGPNMHGQHNGQVYHQVPSSVQCLLFGQWRSLVCRR